MSEKYRLSKTENLLDRYEKITAVLFLPVVFLLTLVHLAAESQGTNFDLQMSFTRPLLLYTTGILALVPFVRLLAGFFVCV